MTVGLAVAELVQTHPKRITAVLAALLLGGGGGAFAVASLAPDAAQLPVQQVLEAVQPLPLQAQIDALDLHSLKLFRTDATRSADTPESLLKRLGLVDAAAAAFLRSNPTARQALFSRAGRSVTAEANDQQELLSLSTRWIDSESDTDFKRLVIEKTAQGFATRVETAPLTASMRLGSGTIQSSLFAATDDARIPDGVATQIAEIFAGNIDFHRGLRKGDRFSVVSESLKAEGEPLRTGRVLSAEFVNTDKTYEAMWFQEPGQKGAYYAMNGESLRRAYLASPMEFSRVTSGFKMRFHPVLQKWRQHNGVDYAAPTGTPVRSVGDGVVSFAGVQNGFGNVVMIKHRNQHETVYAHLSRIGVRKGQNVSQGDTIGAVGSTGWATGPHLHFEFRVNGVYTDPQRIIQQAQSAPITPASRPAFARQADAARLQLAAASQMRDGNEL